jgi:hypothetical protein
MSPKIWGISGALGATFLLAPLACAQHPETSPPSSNQEPLIIHLQADAGTPLRAYLTNHAWYRQNEPVKAKLIVPVWSFDRQIVPAGVILEGRISELLPVPKMMRARAILGGGFHSPQASAGYFYNRFAGWTRGRDSRPPLVRTRHVLCAAAA